MVMGVVVIKGATDSNYTAILPQKDRCNLFSCMQEESDSPYVAGSFFVSFPDVLFYYFFLTSARLCASLHIF